MKDLIGQRFGKLVVVAHVTGTRRWLARCECGTEREFKYSVFMRAPPYSILRSCGCDQFACMAHQHRNRAHGHASGQAPSKTYKTWTGIFERCLNPKSKGWARYGGRGITVCDRWRDSFENFLTDMGERPDGMTLDRKNNDLGYSPENCRWATATEQQKNRGYSKIRIEQESEVIRRLTAGESQVSIARWLGCVPSTISHFLKTAGLR